MNTPAWTSDHDAETLQEYVAARRDQALRENRLIRRMHYLPIADPDAREAYVCQAGKDLQFAVPGAPVGLINNPAHIVAAIFAAALGTASAETLARAASDEAGQYRTKLYDDPRAIPGYVLGIERIVLDTPETLVHMQRVIASINDPLARGASRVLEVAATLAFSSRFPTVTGYLEKAHYIPTGCSAANREALFGLYDSTLAALSPMESTQKAWQEIKARNGELTVEEHASGNLPVSTIPLAKGFYGSESSALGGAQYRSVKAGFSVSRGVESAARYIDGLLALDPLNRECALQFGHVIRPRGCDMSPGGSKVDLYDIEGLCSLKDGERIALRSTSTPRVLPLRIENIRTEGGDLVIEARKEHKISVDDCDDFSAAPGGLHEVFAMRQVFGVFSGRKLRGRYMPGGDRTAAARPMPSDLAAIAR